MFSRLDFGKDAYKFENKYGINAKYLWEGEIITSWDPNAKRNKFF